jgi:phenylalanyl-tRNA synthetase beta chain
VVDVTNYVMLELGQPLHAFDYDRVANHHIIVRRADEGERFTTLDGEERTLSRDMLVIADEEGPVALAGVIGGRDSEVTEDTTNILLEVANFAGRNIRRTSAALKVRTEASARFEKGLPAELALVASKRATKLLVEVCGGRARVGNVDAYPGKTGATRVEVTKERMARVLGIDPAISKVRSVLTSLGFSCRWVPPDRYVVRVPYWRTDVHIADDVAEEVARIIGYYEIPAESLTGHLPPPIEQPRRDLRERTRDLLAAAGMQEVITYALTTLEAISRVIAKEELAIYPPYRVVNPLTADLEYLRPTLRASLLQTLAANIRYQKGEIAIFETARTYQRPDEREQRHGAPAGEDRLPDEREHVTGVISGRRADRWGRPSEDAVDFFDARAYLHALFDGLNVSTEYVAATEFAMTPGRTAELRIDGTRVGVIGQVHPEVAAEFDIDQDVYLFDIVLDDVLPYAGKQKRMAPVSRFPAVEQDIALIVDEEVPAGALHSAIETASLVRSARIFDAYRGDQVPPGKKSVAFDLVYQADDHTLTDDDVAKAQRKLLERLRREFNAELRT